MADKKDDSTVSDRLRDREIGRRDRRGFMEKGDGIMSPAGWVAVGVLAVMLLLR
jgi:hypothetical protein